MDQIFPNANIVAGILVLLVGFGFHFIGQLFSLINWPLATQLGLQEAGMKPDHKSYEHAIAMADVALGWTYGIAGLGLVLDAPWGYAWAWIPGAILTYHAAQFWGWTGAHRRSGDDYSTTKTPFRLTWAIGNLTTGVLALLVANSQMLVP